MTENTFKRKAISDYTVRTQSTKVILLMKFGKREHVQSFVNNGTIFMNPVSFFKSCPGDDERHDPNENITGYFQPKNVQIKIQGRIIKDFAGPISFYNPVDDQLRASHIFCMSHLADEMETYEDEKIFDERVKDFGDAMAVIIKPSSFLSRLEETLNSLVRKNEITGFRFDTVQYVPKNNYSGKMDLFYKTDDYAHQKEIRLALSHASNREDPLSLSLGSISDIAAIVNTADFKNTVSFDSQGKQNIIIS